jgi:hypothetical protein
VVALIVLLVVVEFVIPMLTKGKVKVEPKESEQRAEEVT